MRGTQVFSLLNVVVALIAVAGQVPAADLTLPYSGTVNSTIPAFQLTNTGSGDGIIGTSTSGYGVTGATFSSYTAGVWGSCWGSCTSRGVLGSSGSGEGVLGWSIYGEGVHGKSSSQDGVFGEASAANKSGVFAVNQNAAGYAGYFRGNVSITGTLTKGGGAFRIDHPLDPENRVLQHSFVESPDMKNIYDGVVTTDERGLAVVRLPDWFEALNRDYRYQLTVIGRFAQAIVERKIENGQFAIRTNLGQVEVSWQVTGIRKDPWANAHRIVVEEEKPEAERGTYLHPDVYGQPPEKDVEWARRPELMRRLKAEADKIAQEK